MKINKILIANRGEIAVRIMRTCKEMGVKTVAVYSVADKNSLHVKIADEAYCIGPAASNLSYLKKDNLIQIALATKADAIHPGYGFLAEDAEFAQKCEDADILFIGPKANHINLMGDKIAARDTAVKAGVPIIEGIEGGEKNVQESDFPVLIKASAGGGGKGMRVVYEPSQLKYAVQEAKTEAKAAFGNDAVYIERYIENARHVEVQVIADSHGNVIHLGERECSIQRRHQKLLEESPCLFITEKTRQKLHKDAVDLTLNIGYVNAGTIEFLVDVDRNEHYFIEMNTRIQVEHPVTEMVTGIDIVREQIQISEGQKLSIEQKDVTVSGHSIESRINAEDPENNFMPSPGLIEEYIAPGGLDVRIETFCHSGYRINPFYDSMVGKVIVKGDTREEAIAKLKATLETYYIEGIKTTIPLHLSILNSEDFEKGDFNTKWLESVDL